MNDFKKKQAEVKAQRKEQCGKCVFCAKIRELSTTRQRDFYEAMLDKDITIPTIKSVLGNWGVETSATTLQTHRSTGKQGASKHMLELKKHLDNV